MPKRLRDYQQAISDQVINSDKDLIICLPTGAGKTVVAADIIQRLPGTVIFIVPRLELLDQGKNEFDFPVDIIWSAETKLTGQHCIIASKDSLKTQLKKLPEGEYTLIFDEVHYGLKKSFALVQAIKPKRVLGLTATPERMDGLALLKGSDDIHKYGIFDELLKTETVPSLIRKGFLTPLRYYAKPIEGITSVKPDSSNGEELSGSQMTQIFNDNDIWGDLVKSYELYGRNRPAIGFTTTIEMAEQVAEIFNDAGYKFKVISGEMPMNVRRELIKELKSRQIDGLVNAALLTYGFDCPEASYAFSCRHIKSRPLWFQMIGRILRTYDGKVNAIFVDHGDSISEFSEPNCALPVMDEFITWRVNGESKEEKAARKASTKKVRETMKIIQQLNPLPADMVEITPEETYERLIHIVQKLLQENAEKDAINQKLAKKNAMNEQLVQKKNEETEILKAQLEETKRVVDKDQTFDYIRRNYCSTRRRIEDWNPGLTPDQYHDMTRQELKRQEGKLPFYFDENTFYNSLKYWKDHFKRDWQPAPVPEESQTKSEEK